MKIIVTDEVSPEGLALLTQEPRIQLDIRLGLKKEELLAVIGEYDVIITRSGTTVDKALLDAGKRLKMVARAGVGIDNVDVDYASSKGVIVVNAPFGNTNSAAEHTMALLLSFCRNVTTANNSLKGGEWKRAPFTGHELKGKTAGVIGIGKVGGRVATRLKAFECEVLACDPYIAVKRAHDLGVKLVSHDEIYKHCDIITVHTPLNDETRGMIGPREFGLMKSGVIVLNVARGGIIDEQAMLDGLNSGKVIGGAFDVWSEEPPATEVLKQLIAHKNLVVTPHLGANTFEAQVNVAIDVSREIVNYLDDQPLENAVNIPRFDLALMDQMRPFLNLMSVMCDFGIQLLDSNPEKLTFAYAGSIAHYDCSPLTVCGLSALLNRMVDQDVNMVNASLIAEQMGIVVDETKIDPCRCLLQCHHPGRRRGRQAPADLRHALRRGPAHRQAARLHHGLRSRGAHAAAALRRPPRHDRQDRHHHGAARDQHRLHEPGTQREEGRGHGHPLPRFGRAAERGGRDPGRHRGHLHQGPPYAGRRLYPQLRLRCLIRCRFPTSTRSS